MLQKKRAYWAVMGAVGCCGMLSLAAARSSKESYSEESIKGAWSYVGNGLLVPPAVPEPTPLSSLLIIEFDGVGGCFAHGIVNVLGSSVDTESLDCTYSVDANGWGYSEARFTNAPIDLAFPVAFLITEHGREIQFMNTEFAVGTAVAKRR
jgi:hypothetical protein